MSSYTEALENVFDEEEFITAEEYLRRLQRGELDSENVRMVSPDLTTGDRGGFMVKRKTTQYNLKANYFKKVARGLNV